VRGAGIAALTLLTLAAAAGAQSLKGVRKEFIEVGERVIPATVTVRSAEAPKGMPGSTGVLVHRDGYVLSDADATFKGFSEPDAEGNRKKLHGVDAIVTLPPPDHRSVRAVVVRRDQETDTTLLKIVEPLKRRTRVVPLGSSDDLRVGSFTFVAGNAFGLGKEAEPALSLGVLAGFDPNESRKGGRYRMLYTTAAVNPGSNGGPCVNAEGRLIGIVSTFETNPLSPFRALGKITPVNLLRIAYEGVEDYDRIFPDLTDVKPRSDDAAVLEEAFRIVARRVSMSLVSIEVDRGDAKATQSVMRNALVNGRIQRMKVEIPRYTGPYSGVVLSENGLVITGEANLWAFDKIASVTVHLPGGDAVPAKLLGRDRKRGIALLRVANSDLLPLPAAEKGDLRVGRFALCFGNPYAGTPRDLPLFSFGVISGIHRLGREIDAVQTDAAMNDGMMGGALVTLEGKLLGVSVLRNPEMFGRGSGIGFGIPLTSIEKSLPKLESGAHVEPPYLGTEIAPNPDGKGLVFKNVAPVGPGGKAGLKSGDVLVAADGRPAARFPAPQDLIDLIRSKDAGDVLELKVRRGKEILDIPVTLGVHPRR